MNTVHWAVSPAVLARHKSVERTGAPLGTGGVVEVHDRQKFFLEFEDQLGFREPFLGLIQLAAQLLVNARRSLVKIEGNYGQAVDDSKTARRNELLAESRTRRARDSSDICTRRIWGRWRISERCTPKYNPTIPAGAIWSGKLTADNELSKTQARTDYARARYGYDEQRREEENAARGDLIGGIAGAGMSAVSGYQDEKYLGEMKGYDNSMNEMELLLGEASRTGDWSSFDLRMRDIYPQSANKFRPGTPGTGGRSLFGLR